MNLISPLKDLKVKDDKNTKDLMGFNDHHVFTISQGKKKGVSAELYKDLEYNDFCVDFTIKVISKDDFYIIFTIDIFFSEPR